MGVIWNQQTYQWFLDAGTYTGYPIQLAALLRPHLKGCHSLCDIGCGSALVDIALSGDIPEITCVDVSSEAIDGLSHHLKELSIPNITPLCMDGKQLQSNFDAVMTIFHGQTKDILEDYLPLSKKVFIIVTRTVSITQWGKNIVHHHPNYHSGYTQKLLEEKGLTYQMFSHSLEYGQPFRSKEEAVFFVTHYLPKISPDEAEDFLKEQLLITQDKTFPFYLPKKRDFCIFVIPR